MRINTNLTAMNTYTQYTKNNSKIAGSVAKLSSGYAINTAADNAAGLAISEKMRAQIRGLDKASANAQDAISLVQTAEGALSSSTEILQRMRELAVQSASDTNENEIDRTALQDEFKQLQKELDDIAKNTTFNKKNLLDGSLATVSKNLGVTSLANSGMTVQLGNAATGNYNFSVSTKLESAAVTGVKPTSVELVTDGAATYFSGENTVALGAQAAASDLLNGNYTLKASYADPTSDNGDGNITVTATGDNGQTFSATITKESLATLSTGTAPTLSIKFNAQADDAFNLSLTLGSPITGSENNYDTLAANISKLSVSVAGGVTQRDAEYGVYANLTGASSVKLESGMNSVTFDNGVKVNFDTLTASAVDTSTDAAVDKVGGSITSGALSVMDMVASSGTMTSANLTITDANDALELGEFQIGTTAAGGFLTLTDSQGNVYTSNETIAVTNAAGAAVNVALTFDDANGDPVGGLAGTLAYAGLTATNNVTVTANDTAAATGTVAYSAQNVTAASGSATFSNFQFTDDSVVTNGALTISSEVDGTDTVFTATRTGTTPTETYTARIATSALTVSTTDNSAETATNTLTFTDASGFAGFSVDLATTTNATDTFAFDDDVQLTTAVENAGHNYTKIFGEGTDEDLSVSTASSFSVEATKNAGLTFQVGANEGDSMVINIDKMDANYLGVASASVGSRTAAAAAIKSVDSAINQVSQQRANLGAVKNRLDYKISNLNTSATNLTSAESQIRNVDMAKEMTAFTNANILNQAATAMLAQANSLPQSVLSLIGK